MTKDRQGRPKSLSPFHTLQSKIHRTAPGSATQAAALSGSNGPGDKNQRKCSAGSPLQPAARSGSKEAVSHNDCTKSHSPNPG